MHKRNVNTDSSKSNGGTAKNRQNPQEMVASAPHLQTFQNFDDDAMGEHDRLFGIAGRALNKSFDTVYAIGGIVDLLRAGKDHGTDIHNAIDENAEAQLLTGISLLADSLNEFLVDVSDSFRKQMQEGGDQ